MKKLLSTVLIAGAMFSSSVLAEDLTISTGSKTGSYMKIGVKLSSLLRSYGIDDTTFSVAKSKGSIQNLQRLDKGEAHIVITQKDAYASYVMTNPTILDKGDIVGSLFTECIFVAVKKDGPINDEDDLQKSGVTVAAQRKGSGSSVSWDYARELEPGFKKAATLNKGGLATLGRVSSGSGVDAFFFVANPKDLNNKLLKTDFDDSDMNDTLKSTGEPVYTFKDIDLEKGMFADSITTACTEAVIVVSSDVDEEVADAVADIMLNNSAALKL